MRVRLIEAGLALTLLVATGCEPRGTGTATPAAAPRPTATPTAEPAPPLNPLTGLEVADPSLLKMPAILISISHFPATARPQAGLSFSPFVYEFYITEGATRFLAVFHGEWPAPEIQVRGDCDVRAGPFTGDRPIIGNRVWFDANRDGLQTPGERGIAGLCVNLYDEGGRGLAQTTTDSNGFYGFTAAPGTYWVEFIRPEHLVLVNPHLGSSQVDSDPETSLGRVRVTTSGEDLSIDAGLIPSQSQSPDADAGPPSAQIGPIRSGRLVYRHLARLFENSCLIFAYASPEVREQLPECAVVFHQVLGGGYMLDLDELWEIARENKRRSNSELHYSGYHFSEPPPADGRPASTLEVYFAYQNQSGWYYDPASQSYLRYVDTSEIHEAGILHPETDRLTGRQLQVQNIIVVFAKHEVISPTNLDILLDPGRTGKAILFRDGVTLNIDWSTGSKSSEQAGGQMQFLQKNGEPAELRPGHTWVIVVTPETTVDEETEASWQLNFVPPEGAK
jgi:hypothetical protein